MKALRQPCAEAAGGCQVKSCPETLRVQCGEDGVGNRKKVDLLRTERRPGVWHSGDCKAVASEAGVGVA